MPVRAVSLPVNTCLTMPWGDFCKALHACWEQSTALANWCARELDRRDAVRLPGMGPRDMPPPPKIPDTKKPKDWKGPKTKGNVLRGLYGLAAVALRTDRGFWAGNLGGVASLTRAVQRKYVQDRPAAIWHGERRSARYRYPYPYGVPAKDWDAEMRDGKPVVVLKLPGVEGKVELQLRGGPEFARGLRDFRWVAGCPCPACAEVKAKGDERPTCRKKQLLITRQRASEGCHRRTDSERPPGGAARVSYRIMVKLIVDGPETQKHGDRVLTLCTDPAALWVAGLDGRRAWVLNADHIKRACDWQERHRVRRQRWAEDCKAERRASRRKRRQFQDRRDKACEKQARRMKSWCQESAAHLARFAARQRVGCVLYSDGDKGFLPGFPWHLLKTCLASALAGHGISLFSTSDEEEKALRDAVSCDQSLAPNHEDTQCLRLLKLHEMAQRRLLAAAARPSTTPNPRVSVPRATSRATRSGTPSTSSAGGKVSRRRTPRSAPSAKHAS